MDFDSFENLCSHLERILPPLNSEFVSSIDVSGGVTLESVIVSSKSVLYMLPIKDILSEPAGFQSALMPAW